MKKFFTAISLMFLLSFCCFAQQRTDSLRKAFSAIGNDSVKFQLARQLYTYYEEYKRDSALYFADIRYNIAKKHHRKIEEAYTQGQKGYQQVYLGKFSEALTNITQALAIASDNTLEEKDTWDLTYYKTTGKSRLLTLSMLNHMYGHLMLQTGNPNNQFYFMEGRRIGLEIDNSFRVTVADMVLGGNYIVLNKLDSALFFSKEGEQYAIKANIKKYLVYIWFVMGDIDLKKGNYQQALSYYHSALQNGKTEGNNNGVALTYNRLIDMHKLLGKKDSVLYYAVKSLATVKEMGAVTGASAGEVNIGVAYQQMATAYTLQNKIDSAYHYQQLALRTKDSLGNNRIKNLAAFQQATLDEQFRLQRAEKKRIEIQNQTRIYLLLAGIMVVLVIMLLVYRNSRQKQKAYNLLQKQKAETDIQKEKADAALQHLKATQSQLIQSEKMASLGELTAGIAHEIQNPLNFVNNFSEVSNELIEELLEEREKPQTARNEQTETELLADIKQNLEKINHHGKRADAIVKGMLQHSQSSSGKKELTDINKLADEYLRLAYHGLRAKDNSFNATLKTDLDESIGNINIIPQDIGRVLLNLITNAFYAVQEKSSLKDLTSLYNPAVSISTKKSEGKVLITVSDNGNGIPKNIIDKIFQPFFTTKPTGQGTGLGLSLAYDIVKAHDGELKVATSEDGGTTFTILLPKL